MSVEGYFICIDDDSTHNMLCEFMLRDVFTKATIKTFDQQDKAISFLKSDEFLNSNQLKVIFLDINMPGLSGWDVLQEIEHIKDQSNDPIIYMLSSSIDDLDKERASAISIVKGYIEKPMSIEAIHKLTASLENKVH